MYLHSDYGSLTILAADRVPGLQIHTATGGPTPCRRRAGSSSTWATCWRSGPTTAGRAPSTGWSRRRRARTVRPGAGRSPGSSSPTTTRGSRSSPPAPPPDDPPRYPPVSAGDHLMAKLMGPRTCAPQRGRRPVPAAPLSGAGGPASAQRSATAVEEGERQLDERLGGRLVVVGQAVVDERCGRRGRGTAPRRPRPPGPWPRRGRRSRRTPVVIRAVHLARHARRLRAATPDGRATRRRIERRRRPGRVWASFCADDAHREPDVTSGRAAGPPARLVTALDHRAEAQFARWLIPSGRVASTCAPRTGRALDRCRPPGSGRPARTPRGTPDVVEQQDLGHDRTILARPPGGLPDADAGVGRRTRPPPLRPPRRPGNSSRLRTTLARNSGGEWGSMARRRMTSASRSTMRHTCAQPRNTRWLPVSRRDRGLGCPPATAGRRCGRSGCRPGRRCSRPR